ncbi:MAG: hypothetical protein OQK12_02050, partial [Motiliproteus sp.]|nr:hypothetical protein [Motiliproteus sp.]
KSLSSRYPQFSYTPVVLEAPEAVNEPIEGLTVGDLNQVIKDQFSDLSGYAVYLCGSEQRVNSLRRQAFLCGASMKEIFYDLFVPAVSTESA